MKTAQKSWAKRTPEEKEQYWIDHSVNNRLKRSITRAKKLNKYPAWADKEEIKKIYVQCVLMEKETGISYEVDHIIPLNGENVSGLHVHNNLQIVTKQKNIEKSNKFNDK
jgi:hypothetical protein